MRWRLLGSVLACASLACAVEGAAPDSGSQSAPNHRSIEPPETMDAAEPAPSARAWLAELEPGSHAVGYRQQWLADPTRTLLDPSTGARTKRPILLAVWYPSPVREHPDGDAMVVDDYLRVDLPDAGAWRESLEHQVERARQREVLEGTSTAELPELPTQARRGASWAAGSFPLVLVHPGLGGSFSDNFALWEHLASHGFVVVSSAFVDATGLSSAIEWDPATSIADLDRIFAAASAWPGVDGSRVVVAGHSYGAQAAIAYALTGRDVVGVVSLDSTLEYASADEPWYERPEPARYLGARSRLRVPSLILHSGGRIDYAEGLVHSERTIVSLPALHHEDYTSHGGLLKAAHTAPGRPEAREGYGHMADLVRRFLLRVTSPTELAGDPPVREEQLVLPAEPPPPDVISVLGWIREHGPGSAYERCEERGGAAEPLLNEAGYALLHRGALARAEEVFAAVVERQPESWNAWDSWAESAEAQGKTAESIERYRRALALLEESENEHGKGIDHRARIEARLAELAARRATR